MAIAAARGPGRLRAVRALHDPAWTADGYVSDRWRPVSPVTGRLDAFQWQTPVASLPSDKSAAIESSAFEDAMLAAPPPKRVEAPAKGLVEPQGEVLPEPPAAAPVEPLLRPRRPRRAGQLAAASGRREAGPCRRARARGTAAKTRAGAGRGRAPVPRPPGHSQGAAGKHPAGDPHRPRPRRSRRR